MGKIKPYKNQDYKQIKKELQGKLFEDPEFPATNKSLAFEESDVPQGVVWKRPGEIASDPRLFVDGVSASDFSQGDIGNCWFVAACASIAGEPKCMKKIVPEPEEQEWGSDYAGIFHFHFFQFGQWYDVVIDDLLPTREGRLIYVHSNDKNEFWSALLEKAYAKLFGDYKSLESGKARDALEDMMGGVSEAVDLADWRGEQKKVDFLFEQLHDAFEDHSLMSASIAVTDAAEIEAKLDNGLVKGHAYSITSVKKISVGSGLVSFFKNEKIHLIRCRNPWGQKEWAGAWGDNSEEWKKISDKEKKDLGLDAGDDGEFWMSFDDFVENFTSMDICHMINTAFFSFTNKYKESIFFGSWKKPHLSGGCGNFETFLQNPQFLFDIEDKEGDVMISLAQEDARVNRDLGEKNATIGFAIYKADLNRTCRMHDKVWKVSSGPYINSRSVFKRLKIPQGRYLLVPSSFDPGHVGKYMLRVYSKDDVKPRELLEDAPVPGGCCSKKLKLGVQLYLFKAVGLEKQDMTGGGADPYLVVKCEGKEFKTPVCYDTLNPEWNWRMTFYKSNPNSDIIIEVKNCNTIKDEMMGTINIMGSSSKSKEEGVQAMPMLGVGKEAATYKPGKLYVQIKNFLDLNEA
jgi:calpain-5